MLHKRVEDNTNHKTSSFSCRHSKSASCTVIYVWFLSALALYFANSCHCYNPSIRTRLLGMSLWPNYFYSIQSRKKPHMLSFAAFKVPQEGGEHTTTSCFPQDSSFFALLDWIDKNAQISEVYWGCTAWKSSLTCIANIEQTEAQQQVTMVQEERRITWYSFGGGNRVGKSCFITSMLFKLAKLPPSFNQFLVEHWLNKIKHSSFIFLYLWYKWG